MPADKNRKLKRLNRVFPHLGLGERLLHLQEVFSGGGVFAASLEPESRVITHAVESARLPIGIFTLEQAAELERALCTASVWLTGLRREHLPLRANAAARAFFEYDENYRIYRFHPLFDWSLADLETWLERNGLPCPPPPLPARFPAISGRGDCGLHAA